MRYMKNNGEIMDSYPHSFGRQDFRKLDTLLASAKDTMTMHEVAHGYTAQTYIGIRHDVDHNIEHALKFAKWEAARGYRSTYFVLHTAWYYQYKKKLYRCMSEMIDLGHEIGIHHNAVGMLYLKHKLAPVDGSALPAGFCREAAEILMYEIELLNDAGFIIRGCAAHGAGIPEVSNMDLWAAGYTTEDFGLEYEAYHLHRNAYYVTDNRGVWTSEHNMPEEPQLHPGYQLHLSMHPCHWDFEEVE